MARVSEHEILELVRSAARADLPELIGVLNRASAEALARLVAPAPTPPSENRLMSIEDASALLGRSTDWLYRNSHKLPFARKVGRMWRYSAKGIQQYIEQ